MRVTEWKMKFARLSLVMILCVTIVPGRVFADDGTPSGATSPVKLDTPKPGLTEREQYLLDRVEQLEKLSHQPYDFTHLVSLLNVTAKATASVLAGLDPNSNQGKMRDEIHGLLAAGGGPG